MAYDLINYNPMYIEEPTERPTKYKVRNTEWNSLWRLATLQSNNTASALKALIDKLNTEIWQPSWDTWPELSSAIIDLSGAGRTNETVKGTADALATYIAANDLAVAAKLLRPGVAVAGHVAVFNADRDVVDGGYFGDMLKPVIPGDTVLLTVASITVTSSKYMISRLYNVARPGRYRVTGLIRSSAGTSTKVQLRFPGFAGGTTASNKDIEASNEFATSSTTDVPFTLDMTLGVPVGGYIALFVYTSATTATLTNVQLKYADDPNPMTAYVTAVNIEM